MIMCSMVDTERRLMSDEGSLGLHCLVYCRQTLNFPNPSWHQSAHVYMVAPKVAHIDAARNIADLLRPRGCQQAMSKASVVS